MLTLNMIPTENMNMIHFKKRLLPNCLPHDLEIVTVNGGVSTSQYHTPLTAAKFTGKQKKIKFSYFITTPHTLMPRTLLWH
jgi:pyridoxine 5'-phosphate synthase PdxJ